MPGFSRRNYFAHRKDAIHDPTVRALEDDPGTSVHSTAGAGDGFPDIVVGVRDALTIVGDPAAVRSLRSALANHPVAGLVIHDGANLIVELKSSRRADNRNTGKKTRNRQGEWRRGWRGQQAKTYSIDETLALVGRRRHPLFRDQEELPPCPEQPPVTNSTTAATSRVPRPRAPKRNSSS